MRQSVDWISGRRRYRSLTEQQADWIEALFDTFLPNEVPRPQRLFNSFNLPYGQAQYVARVLNDRSQLRLRSLARAELRTSLQERESTAREAVAAGDPSVLQSIMISSSALLELTRLCSDIFAAERTFKWPKTRSRFGDMRQVELESGALLNILLCPPEQLGARPEAVEAPLGFERQQLH